MNDIDKIMIIFSSTHSFNGTLTQQLKVGISIPISDSFHKIWRSKELNYHANYRVWEHKYPVAI